MEFMSLFDIWSDLVDKASQSQVENEVFWKGYLLKEQKNYEKILSAKNTKLEGRLGDLASEFDMDSVTFVGFLDGINTSLMAEIDLDSLTEDTALDSTIDFEKLYYEMHSAKAEWLYTLKEWDDILTEDERKEIKKKYNKENTVVKEDLPGRNDPCPCGSGKKYKKCCMNKA
jgi:hypothetical protein